MGLIVILVALLPAILLWLYIWKKDTRKEPTLLLVKTMLWGMAICIPVALIEMGIQTALFGEGGEPTSIVDTTVMAFIVAAVPEETFKLLALWVILRKNAYFDEHFDGIVYAVCVGLGFAAFENVLYLFSYDEWVSVAFVRSLLAVPGHYAFAILMGYYYSVYHFVDHSPKVAACVLLVPILAHGAYDAIAMNGMINQYVGGLSFFVLIYFCVKLHRVARAKVLALADENSDRTRLGKDSLL